MTTHVFESMGTVVSVRFEADVAPSAVLDRVEHSFAELDRRYSLYNPNSEISEVASGALRLQDASLHLLDTYSLATEWRSRTNGAFTPHRPDGVIDLSGVVKAIAMETAARELDFAGIRGWILNAGGDIISSPRTLGPAPWAVGLADPAKRGELLTSLALTGSRRACATSGSAERGDHIWSSLESADFVQATVVADDILTADVLATAIIAGGRQMLDLACRTWPVDVLVVDSAGEIMATPGARASMLAAHELLDSIH